jgi:hypothetical protein
VFTPWLGILWESSPIVQVDGPSHCLNIILEIDSDLLNQFEQSLNVGHSPAFPIFEREFFDF